MAEKRTRAKDNSKRSSSQHQTTKSIKAVETSEENLAHFGNRSSILTKQKSSDQRRHSEDRGMGTRSNQRKRESPEQKHEVLFTFENEEKEARIIKPCFEFQNSNTNSNTSPNNQLKSNNIEEVNVSAKEAKPEQLKDIKGSAVICQSQFAHTPHTRNFKGKESIHIDLSNSFDNGTGPMGSQTPQIKSIGNVFHPNRVSLDYRKNQNPLTTVPSFSEAPAIGLTPYKTATKQKMGIN